MQTASHNISNANTEGYSRQKVDQQANNTVRDGNLIVGTGVRVTGISRINDEFMEKKLHSAVSANGYNEARSFFLSQVEGVFNEVSSDGLNKIINKFFNSFRELSNQPDNDTVRSIVKESGRMVASNFKKLRGELDALTKSIDFQLESSISDINQITNSICKLNKEIVNIEQGQGETGDLRDQRDLALKKLSEYFAINTYRDERNNYIVSVDGIGTLVSGGQVQELIAVAPPRDADDPLPQGSKEIYFANNKTRVLTDKFTNGKLAGAIDTRKTEVVNTQKALDSLAYNMAMSVNAIHSKGFSNKKVPVNEMGEFEYNKVNQKITGINFFKTPDRLHRAAEFIDLSDELKESTNNIVSALVPNRPGDNRISLAISKLQHEKFLDDGNATLEEVYLKNAGQIGLASKKTKVDSEQSQGLLAQAIAVREKVAGVSLDEETSNMMKFQHMYDASARVMKVADETFKSILGIMR